MKKIQLPLLLLLLSGSAHSDVEIDPLEEAYYYIWSGCANCCESGEGLHWYVSSVVKTTAYHDSGEVDAFFRRVRSEYPNGDPNGELSNGFTTRAEAESDRAETIRDFLYNDDEAQIHDIRL